MSITTYVLDSKGQKVKVYDLHMVFYPEYAHYDKTGNCQLFPVPHWGHQIPNIYNCRPFGCECSTPQGTLMPFDEAKKAFNELQKEMRWNIEELSKWVFKEKVIISYRELEHRRLDMIGHSPIRTYKAWLTKPSRKHLFGQVRADVYERKKVFI